MTEEVKVTVGPEWCFISDANQGSHNAWFSSDQMVSGIFFLPCSAISSPKELRSASPGICLLPLVSGTACLMSSFSAPSPYLSSGIGTLTIFDLGYIPNHNLGHWDLDHLASPDHSELLLLLDAALQASELFFFAPVIEGRDKNHADD